MFDSVNPLLQIGIRELNNRQGRSSVWLSPTFTVISQQHFMFLPYFYLLFLQLLLITPSFGGGGIRFYKAFLINFISQILQRGYQE